MQTALLHVTAPTCHLQVRQALRTGGAGRQCLHAAAPLRVQHHCSVSRRQRSSWRCQAAPKKAAVEEEVDIEEEAMEKMEKSLEQVKRSFATVRTGRASPSMLARIEVDYYGAPTPLQQLAGVSVPEATQLVIQPYDTSMLGAVEKAIMTSDLGLTPSNDGRIIRLQIPQLTAERRKEMGKTVSKLGEEGKVAIRNVRRDAMKAIEKAEKSGAMGEDERKTLEEAVQELTDDYVKQVEGLIKKKQDELTVV